MSNMLGAKDVAQGMSICVKETKGRTNKRVNKLGLYLFEKGHARHTNNRSQYMPSGIVCQVLMYVNALTKVFQGMLGTICSMPTHDRRVPFCASTCHHVLGCQCHHKMF